MAVSPSKISRLEDEGAEDSCGDANEMEVQEPDEDQDTYEDQGMDIIQQSSHASHQVQSNKGRSVFIFLYLLHIYIHTEFQYLSQPINLFI